MQSLIPTFPPMGKAKKQRAKQRARDRGNPMASVADAGIEGAPTEAAVAKRYEGVRRPQPLLPAGAGRSPTPAPRSNRWM